jgi:hypothetical protein
MLDYSEFDFESLLSEKQSLEKYFSDVYSSEEVKGLLKLYTKNFLKPRQVLKKKDLPFTSVMIIVSGCIGVYHYPDGRKTLFKELKSKEIIGDFELNFISSRSAQYEALSKVTIMKFPKSDYERVTIVREIEHRTEKLEYLTKNYEIFANMDQEKMYRLSKNIKTKNLKKNEAVVLKGKSIVS